MLFLHKVLLQLLLVITIAHADKCPDGSAGLTKALYEGKDPSKYKDVTCVPKDEFYQYAGTVVLKGLKWLKSFEHGAFSNMKGKLTIEGEYPALEFIGGWAFDSSGNAQSSITFISLPKLKDISDAAFQRLEGILTFTGSFPSLESIGKSAFNSIANGATSVAIVCSSPSGALSLGEYAFDYYGGNFNGDAWDQFYAKMQTPCYGVPGTSCTLITSLAHFGFDCEAGTTGECITHCCAAAAPPDATTPTTATTTTTALFTNTTAPTCSTECDNTGACVLPLTLASSSTSPGNVWTTADTYASAIRDLPASLVQGTPFVVSDLRAPDLFSLAKRGGDNGKTVDTSQLQLIVVWAKDAATDAAAVQKYDTYIGTSPPIASNSDPSTILSPSGSSDADPGGLFQLEPKTGLMIIAPERAGNYTAWFLIEDPAGVQKATASNLERPKEYNQAVVARWSFSVRGKRPFSLLSWKRTKVDDSNSNTNAGSTTTDYIPTQYIKKDSDDATEKATLECVVGSSYRIAPIDNSTVKVANAAILFNGDQQAQVTFSLKGAPPGFFVDTSNGEILGVPTDSTNGKTFTAELLVVDAAGSEIMMEQIAIIVGEQPVFSVQVAVEDQTRSAKDGYTIPTDETVYYVGETYLIAPPTLDKSNTTVSAGTVEDIKYTLVGAPSSWFINADTGEMSGTFNESKQHAFNITAVDDGGKQVTLEEYQFNVVRREAFEVIKYTHQPSKERDFAPTDYTDPTTTTVYAVGDTYRFASTALEKVKNTDDALADLQFTIDGAPQGFLIDTKDGYIQGTPTKPGTYTVTLFAVDSRNQKAKVESLHLEVKLIDTDKPENGPNKKRCEHGAAVDDGDRFDNAFTCDCAGTSYEGQNCEIEVIASGSNTGKVSGGLIGGFVAFLILFGAVYKYRVHQLSMRAFDFEQQLTVMTVSGEIDPVRDGPVGPRIPREIKRSHVTPTQVVGSGAFGDVWKAVLDESRAGGVPGYICAVKTSKDATGDGADEIRKEALVMAQFVDHPNVVALIGVVTSGTPLMLLIALCENGSLQSCLQENKLSNRNPSPAAAAAVATTATATAGYIAPSNFDTLKMAIEIARGMDHLVKAKFVHRDLATRNVLLDSQFICKIADFGLSRGIGATDADDDDVKEYYTSHGGTFPVRWTAPEAIETMKFSTATDIWSYGVVLLEITTGGTRPYNAKKNQEVIASVQGGYRAPRPEAGCSPELYNEVMLKCWDADPKVRPSFHELIAILQAQLESVQGEHDFPEGRAAAVDPSAANATAGASEEYLVPGEQVVQSTSALATATSVLGEPEYELETKYELAAPTAQSAGELHRDPAVAVAAPSAAALPRPAAPAPAAFARFRLSLEEQADDSMSLLSI